MFARPRHLNKRHEIHTVKFNGTILKIQMNRFDTKSFKLTMIAMENNVT
jgi:hypothetical protein